MAAVCPHVRLVSTVLGRTGCKSEGEEVAVTISALVTHSAVAVDLLSGTRTVPAPSTGPPSTYTHEGVPLSVSRLSSRAFWDGVATATSAHRVVGDPRRPTGCASIREACSVVRSSWCELEQALPNTARLIWVKSGLWFLVAATNEYIPAVLRAGLEMLVAITLGDDQPEPQGRLELISQQWVPSSLS